MMLSLKLMGMMGYALHLAVIPMILSLSCNLQGILLGVGKGEGERGISRGAVCIDLRVKESVLSRVQNAH